jgi:hypothetical protein
LSTLETIVNQARQARRMAEELYSDDQAPAVRALALATMQLADELVSLVEAITELGGRLEFGQGADGEKSS